MQRKYRKFATSRWISSTFPPFAHTSVKTHGAIENTAFQTTAGFVTIGHLSPDSYKDPLGNVSVATIAGSTANSTIEAVGHDDLATIYGSYRIPTSTCVISISQVPRGLEQKEQTAATTDFTSTVIQGADADGFNVGYSSGKWLIAIPSTQEATAPASSWREAMHHPFAFKKWIPPAPFQRAGKRVSLKLKLNHTQFIKMFQRDSRDDHGQEQTWIGIDGNPSTGHNITWHLFICATSSQSDVPHPFSIGYSIYQQVEFAKWIAADTSITTIVGDDHVYTEA